MALIFGFDIGTTSIGFAAIAYDEAAQTGSILRMGTRIFPEARDPDGTPLNQTRRTKRMMRRQLRRRRDRRRTLNEALAATGLLPAYGSPAWQIAMATDPVDLRARGLSERLEPHEIGRALYHLAKRRHFRGRDLEEAEDGTLLEGAAAEQGADDKELGERLKTVAALDRSGETLGALLAKVPAGERQRGRHALRRHVQDEFDRLWAAQAPHHPALLSDAARAHLADIVFAQKPVFWRLNTLGECRLEPGAPLAAKGSWLSAQRRMLEKLNNLEVEGGNRRPLTEAERAAVLEKLQVQGSMTFAGVRAAIEPLLKADGLSARYLKFNLEVGGDRHLPGNPVEAKLTSIFGETWAAHPHRQAIREATEDLRRADYGEIGTQRVVIKRTAERARDRAAAAASFAERFGATDEQVAKLGQLSFPTGWDAFSVSAIGKLMGHLEAGVRMGSLLNSPDWAQWRQATFPHRAEQPTGELLDKLHSPAHPDEAARIKRLRNPTVVRTQNELRKVVNNLIDFCGRKPDLIRVELARDVGKGNAEREEIQSAIRKQEKQRARAEADLKANGIAAPARRDIEKWLLWKECGEKCPYTGDPIGFAALFRDNLFEVEHIWPRSRSLDDSFRNKTLCRKDVNLKKGNRTPFEMFGKDAEAWDAMGRRLAVMMAAKGGDGMARGKVKRFLAETIPYDFASRQLNDTGYAARQALEQLKRLWPDVGKEAPVTVQAVNGKVTAHLRKLWGLNNLLGDTGEKNRADHRHHAVDALTVACAAPGVTNRLSRYWQLKDDPREAPGEAPHVDAPWATIRRDAEAAVAQIVVSHRVRKKVSGPLHLETVYGDTGQDVTTKTGTYREFVRRKKVEMLTKGEYEAIRDGHVRDIMKAFLAEHGGDPKKIKWTAYPRVSPGGAEIRSVRILVKQQIALMAPVSTGFADLGSNHHIAIYQRPDGKAEFEVVSLFEASRRLARREPVVRREREGCRFVMSLAAGDTVSVPSHHKNAGQWTAKGVWASGVVVLVRHTDSTGDSTWLPRGGMLPGFGATKVSVDPIGRIRPAND
jgi:CRISPR-associated endonuclease Csn1